MSMCCDLLAKHFNLLRRKYKQLYEKLKDNYEESDMIKKYKIPFKKYVVKKFIDDDSEEK